MKNPRFMALSMMCDGLFVGIALARHAEKETQGGIETPVISVGDIHDGVIVAEGVKRVRLRAEALDRYRVRDGDVLLSCRGTLLKAARVTSEIAGWIPSNN